MLFRIICQIFLPIMLVCSSSPTSDVLRKSFRVSNPGMQLEDFDINEELLDHYLDVLLKPNDVDTENKLGDNLQMKQRVKDQKSSRKFDPSQSAPLNRRVRSQSQRLERLTSQSLSNHLRHIRKIGELGSTD